MLTRTNLRPFILLWLTGLSLRVTVLAVPPLALRIRADLGLTSAEVAALTTLPLLLFSVAATLGSGIVSLVGARRTLISGLLIAAAAAALRGAAPSAGPLFAFTFAMGLGIAAVQPAMPSIVQSWVPESIGRATATYVNGLLVAEAAAASLTLPILIPLLGGWQPAMALWSAPLVVTALLVASLTHEDAPVVRAGTGWLPSWSQGLTWQLGAMQAAGSVAYFASNALLPVFLDAQQRGDLVGWSLSVLNTSQLFASVVVAALPLGIIAGRTALVLNGGLIIAGAVGLGAAPGLAVLWSGLIGFCAAVVFIVSLALPAALTVGPEVARLAAGMMTIGYGCAFLLPLFGGALFDATGAPWTALSPIAAAGSGAVTVGAIGMHGRRHKRQVR